MNIIIPFELQMPSNRTQLDEMSALLGKFPISTSPIHPMLKYFLFNGLIFFSCIHLLQAEQIQFTNGDIITVDVIEITENTLIVESPLLGKLSIPKASLLTPEAFKRNEPEQNEAERVQKALDSTESSLTKITQIEEPTRKSWSGRIFNKNNLINNPLLHGLRIINPFKNWKNKLDLGITYQSAEINQKALNVRFETKRTFDKKQSVRLLSQYDFRTNTNADGVKSVAQDLFKSSLRYRYDIAKFFFIQNNTAYKNDSIQRIDHEISETIGVGYRWLETERAVSSITPNLGAEYRDIQNRPFEWNLLSAIQQDFEYNLSENITIEEDFTIGLTIEDNTAYFYALSAALENKLTERLSLNLRYEYAYDERLTTNQKDSQNIKITLGAGF